MNRSWSRFLRSTYRREPIVSFVVTAGVVEAAIGGLGEHWLLMMFGLGTAGAAMTLRWWQQYRSISTASDRAPIYVLPPRSSRPVLPTLRLQTPPDSKR